jgi:hypothetical protein
MLIMMTLKDTCAADFAVKHLSANEETRKENVTEGTVTMESHLLGPNTLGLYTLPAEKMYPRSADPESTRKLTMSLYSQANAQSAAAKVEDRGVKRIRRALRPLRQPEQLENCEIFLAINRDTVDDIDKGHLSRYVARETRLRIPSALKERGGSVAYLSLPSSRVICPASPQPSGLDHVEYGTSALHNLAELFSALKAGCKFDLPVHFNSYGYAVSGVRIAEVILTSLKLVDPERRLEYVKTLLGWETLDKPSNTIEITPESFLARLGLSIPQEAILPKSTTLDIFYRVGMKLVAERLLTAVEKKVTLDISDTSRMLGEVSSIPLRTLAAEIEEVLGHTVGLLSSNGQSLVTTEEARTERWENVTLDEMHASGAYASGALIYHSFYRQARNLKFIAMLRDGNKGGVHRLARRYMRDPHGLWICPAGALNILPVGEMGFNFLDPWVFMEIMGQWGEEKSTQHLREIWDVVTVPLPANEVGKVVNVYVSMDGIKIEVIKPTIA